LAGDFDHVGLALGGEQRNPRSSPFQQRIRRDRRSVGEHPRSASSVDRLAHCSGRVIRGGEDLDDLTPLVDQVGERTAGIDADPGGSCLGLYGSSTHTSSSPR
jgi:hypothetical protein